MPHYGHYRPQYHRSNACSTHSHPANNIDNTWLIKSPVRGLPHEPGLAPRWLRVVEGGGGRGGLGARGVTRGGRDDAGGPVEAQVGAGARHGARGECVVTRRRPLVAKHRDVGLEWRNVSEDCLNCPRNS